MFRISKYNNVIKVDEGIATLVPMGTQDPLYLEYLEYLTNEGEVSNSELFDPAEVIIANTPSEVALWKLRFVLSQMQLETNVTDAINLLPEPQKTAATYIWNYGNAIDRHSSTVEFIKDVLNMNDMEVNSIFIEANSITL